MLKVAAEEGFCDVKIFGFMAGNASVGWNVVWEVIWGGNQTQREI